MKGGTGDPASLRQAEAGGKARANPTRGQPQCTFCNTRQFHKALTGEPERLVDRLADWKYEGATTPYNAAFAADGVVLAAMGVQGLLEMEAKVDEWWRFMLSEDQPPPRYLPMTCMSRLRPCNHSVPMTSMSQLRPCSDSVPLPTAGGCLLECVAWPHRDVRRSKTD